MYALSEASRYLPSRTEAVKVKIGIAKTELVELPLFGFVKMGKLVDLLPSTHI